MHGLNGNIYNSLLTSNFQVIIYNITFILNVTLYPRFLSIYCYNKLFYSARDVLMLILFLHHTTHKTCILSIDIMSIQCTYSVNEAEELKMYIGAKRNKFCISRIPLENTTTFFLDF
jgi:hypothetical protein